MRQADVLQQKRVTMQTVSLRVNRRERVVLAVFRCERCGERVNSSAAHAIRHIISCKQCGYQMDMREATIAAVVAARESRYEPLLCADASNPMLRAAELALRWVKKILGELRRIATRVRQSESN